MSHIEHSDRVSGVLIAHLQPHADERGRFLETFRQSWLGERPAMLQANRSDSRRGAVRGLHYHMHQADYWYAPAGRVFVALYDVRRSSTTSGSAHTFEIGEGAELGVYIPPGVAHGFQALTDATLTYLVDRYYDPDDEHGVAWDDPDVAIDWPIRDAVLSARDRANPRLAEISPGLLPA